MLVQVELLDISQDLMMYSPFQEQQEHLLNLKLRFLDTYSST